MELSRPWNNTEITQRASDGYFDATGMCKACGTKRFVEYSRSNRCIEYVGALSKVLSIPSGLDDGETSPQGSLVQVARGGTWIHPRVAIELARWLCVDFAIWMDGWVLEMLGRRTVDTSTAPLPVEDVETPEARLFVHQVSIINETDLHNQVVAWIRRFYPNAMIVAGLGELQDSENKRISAWRKGYTKGQPDLLILNRHRKYAGFAIELKHPGNKQLHLSSAQEELLERMGRLGLKTLASNDYDFICREIQDYLNSEVFFCKCCSLYFASPKALEVHLLRKRLRDAEDNDENV